VTQKIYHPAPCTHTNPFLRIMQR